MLTRKRPAKKNAGVRLFQVLRELNVAADTVVDTLREGGYELDAKLADGNPNARLEPAMYATLVEKYSDDAEAKARVRELRAQIAAEEAEAAPAPEPAAETAKKAEAPRKEAPEPVSETPAEPAAEAPAEPVAGTSEPKAAEPTPEPETPEPAAEPTPEPVAQAPEPVAEAPKAVEPVAETPTADAPAGAAPGAAPAAAPDAGAPDAEAPADPLTPSPETDDAGIVRAGRYALTGTTVLGKIDLSGLDSGSRRKRKSSSAATPAQDAGSAATPAKGGRPGRAPKPGEVAGNAPVAPPAEGEGRGRGRKKKGRRGEPDRTEVSENVSETLNKLGSGGGKGRGRQKRRRARRDERAADRERREEEFLAQSQILRVMEFISTGDLAEAMNVPVTDVISKGFGLGMMVSINQRLDADTITLFADEFDYEVEFMTETEEEFDLDFEDDPEDLVDRPPIVTIMGHVDHGKTSLLDYIRKANVVAGEAGGITQHIGAYQITTDDGRPVTFLDTPGHEAFTAMRARGAQVTDLVIVVVAADDQVMPQTIEAINHSRAAEVPMVIAINKMDRPAANPDKIMAQLAEQGVSVEQYGGAVQCELISAQTGDNVDSLLEKVLLEADLLELKANPDRHAVGTVVEARLDKGRGVVATVLVQNGTMEDGDAYVVGLTSGRVRAMFNERDQRVDVAGPSAPVQILGLADAPEVGDRLYVLDDEREARDIASRRQALIREQTLQGRRRVTLDDLSRRMAEGEITNLNLVVKADVGGSVEALSDALLKLSNGEVAVDIVHSGVGAITESDVMLAAASDAIIIGFQVRPVTGVRQIAEREQIDIRSYSVIYDAINEVRDALEGLLSPEEKETVTATVDVRDIFRAPKVGTIAGCYVVEGKISRNDRVRLLREGVVVYNGQLDSMRRFKDDVTTVAAGYECGLSIRNFNDIKVGDQIESYVVTEEKRTLDV